MHDLSDFVVRRGRCLSAAGERDVVVLKGREPGYRYWGTELKVPLDYFLQDDGSLQFYQVIVGGPQSLAETGEHYGLYRSIGDAVAAAEELKNAGIKWLPDPATENLV